MGENDVSDTLCTMYKCQKQNSIGLFFIILPFTLQPVKMADSSFLTQKQLHFLKKCIFHYLLVFTIFDISHNRLKMVARSHFSGCNDSALTIGLLYSGGTLCWCPFVPYLKRFWFKALQGTLATKHTYFQMTTQHLIILVVVSYEKCLCT